MTPAVYLTVQRTAFTPPAVFNNAVFSAFEQSLCDSHLSAVYVTTADGKIFDIKYPPKSDFLAHRQRSGRSAQKSQYADSIFHGVVKLVCDAFTVNKNICGKYHPAYHAPHAAFTFQQVVSRRIGVNIFISESGNNVMLSAALNINNAEHISLLFSSRNLATSL